MSLTVKWWSSPRISAGTTLAGEGIMAVGYARRGRILLGADRAHQFVVALDFQLAAVEHCVVAQVGVKTDTLAGRCVLVSGESASAFRPSLPFPIHPR